MSQSRIAFKASATRPSDVEEVARDNPLPVSAETKPAQSSTWGTGTVQTAATGTNYTALGANACSEVALTNATAVTLAFRRVGSSNNPARLLPGDTIVIPVIANSNEIEVKRLDDDNTQVTTSFVFAAY